MSEWVSVKDRLPKKYIPVIVCCLSDYGHCNDLFTAMLLDGNKEWRRYIGGIRTKSNPTHWMTLPELPNE